MLIVALVTSLALACAAMALIRASSAALAAGGNVHARRQAALAAPAAIEHAVVALVRDRVIDPRNDDLAHNYYASRQAGDDSRGVPRALQSGRDYPESAPIIDVAGYRVRHVIERLCLLAGDATSTNCALSPPSVDAARGSPPPGEPPREPSYRVSVRVDGPAAGVVYAQAILSPGHSNPRRSWRLLDE